MRMRVVRRRMHRCLKSRSTPSPRICVITANLNWSPWSREPRQPIQHACPSGSPPSLRAGWAGLMDWPPYVEGIVGGRACLGKQIIDDRQWADRRVIPRLAVGPVIAIQDHTVATVNVDRVFVIGRVRQLQRFSPAARPRDREVPDPSAATDLQRHPPPTLTGRHEVDAGEDLCGERVSACRDRSLTLACRHWRQVAPTPQLRERARQLPPMIVDHMCGRATVIVCGWPSSPPEHRATVPRQQSPHTSRSHDRATRGKSSSLAMWFSAQSAPPTANAQLAAAKSQQPRQEQHHAPGRRARRCMSM
jgi:hypothetical protein